MKNLFLILAAVAALTLCSCEKDDDKTPLEQLPPATTTGANTAGCLVNGQVFLPKGKSLSSPILSCFYQQDQDGYHFGLGIADKTNNIKAINVTTNPLQLLENTTYNLVERTSDANNNYISNFGQYTIYSNTSQDIKFETTNTLSGELKITKLDTLKKIISGTFWYDAINISGEKVEVREGRFDMHYVN